MIKEHNTFHFDIKPENIFYKNKNLVKLADFGFSCKNEEINEERIKFIWKNRNLLYVPPEISKLS